MRPSSRLFSLRHLTATGLLGATAVLTGCGLGSSSNAGGGHAVAISLSGRAHGGQQPVVGATVKLYAAGNAGNGSAATTLGTATSDVNGNFYFGTSNSNPIYCPSTISSGAPTASDTLYLIASGGNPGSGSNSASVLMTVVGDCRNLENTQAFVMIDESSTFASITALQQFFNATNETIGAPSTNLVGLANAAITAGNLTSNVHVVSAASGADASVTGATVTVTPDITKLNAGADILAACVNTADTVNGNTVTHSAACSTLFSNAGSGTPTDTLQAAYYMASTPTGVGTPVACTGAGGTVTAPSICTLFELPPPGAPFLPLPNAAPTDWTVGVTYATSSQGTGTGTPYLMNSPEYIALDGQGNIWITNYASTAAASAITELSPTGAPLKQALNGAFLKASAMAIDPFGNVWVSNAGATSIVEYTTAGATNTYTTTVAPYSLTIDGQGNVFEIGKNGTVIQEIPVGSSSGTTPTTVTTGLTTTYPALTFDTKYNLWLATATTVDEMLYGSYGTVHNVGSITGLTAPETITVDPSNNIWAGNYSTTAGSLTKITANNTGASFAGSSFADATGLYDNKMVASDSAGNIFTANSHSTSGGVVEFSNTGTLLSPAAGFAHTYYLSQSAAIDPSGNVWVGSEETNGSGFTAFITQIVGVAAPTITPIASNLPATPTSTAKPSLIYSSVPNVYAIPGSAASYSATLSSTNPSSTTGTFTLISPGGTVGTVSTSVAPGGSVNYTIPSSATSTATPGTYTGQLNYSGDSVYAPSSVPVTFIVEPVAGSGGLITSSMTGTAQSGAGSSALPIVGGTATLWATANNGVPTTQASINSGEIDGSFYLGAAVPLATATTTSTGAFTFGTFGCASPDQLYITVNGGQTSGTTANNNIVLLAALGTCNSTTTALTPIVNEVTTAAAAYTLAPFISIKTATPTSGSAYYDVNITASATNYATYAQSIGTIYNPVGLQHAFLNAANLANVSTGLAQTALSGYTTTTPILPTALLNSVANVLATCVQTAGTCSGIFSTALPLTSGTAVVPTNTLGAMLNVARNPFMGGGGKAATWLGLSTVSSSTGAYTPVLTVTGAGTTAALPHDLTAAIFYPAGVDGNKYNNTSTLDANDNYYLISETTSASPYYYESIGNASNGKNLFTHQFCQTSQTYNQTTQTTCPEILVGTVYSLTADQLGDLWLSVNGTSTATTTSTFSSTQSSLIQLVASTGAFANVPANTTTQESTYIVPGLLGYGSALDQNNNLYVGVSSTTGNIYKYTYTGTASAPYSATAIGTTLGSCGTDYSYDLQFDGQGNLFCSGYYASTTHANYVDVVPNQSLTSTAYPAATAGPYAESYTTQSTPINVEEQTSSGPSFYGISLAFDSLGNVYQGTGQTTTSPYTGDGLYLVTKNYNTTNPANPVVSSLSLNTTPIDGAAISTTNGLINAQMIRPEFITQDGMGAIWVPDTYLDTIVRVYGPTGTSVLALYPCVGTTCYTTGNAYVSTATGFYGARQSYVDSTGTVYVMSQSGSNSTWAQIFGVGVPDFPLAQANHPAQMP